MTHYQVILGRVPNQSSDFQTNPKSYLDTFGEESISLNYNIADINDLANKNSSYSKTIRFPNTRNNQQVFSDIWSLNMTTAYITNTNNYIFDPNIKTRAWILKDNVIQFEGNLQLTNIVYDYIQDTITYECVVYSENDGLYKSIGELYLTDLNSDRFNHTWNSTNVLASWEAPYGVGYYYPMIDYGVPLSISRTFRTTDFLPAFYVKTIWDQIFAEAGYTYKSDFLKSDFFNHLIIPYSNKNLPGNIDLFLSTKKEVLNVIQQQTYTYSYVSSSPNTTTGIYGISGQYFFHGGYMVGDTSIFNLNNLYNFTYSYYQAPPDQRFAQKIVVDLGFLTSRLQYTNSPFFSKFGTDGGGRRQNFGDLVVVVARSRNANNFGVTGSVYNVFDAPVPPSPNDAAWETLTFGGRRFYSLKNNPQGVQEGFDANTGFWQWSGKIETDLIIDPSTIQENERIMVWIGRQYPMTFINQDNLGALVSSTITTTNISISVVYDDTVNVEGGKITPSKILPNIRQKDFITNIIRMFNLYIDEDKSSPKSFIIEPRDDYYAKYQQTRDWSEKLDLSKEVKSQIASNTQNRTLILTYKEDKDYFNKEYSNITNTIFGEYKYDYNNEFTSGEKKIELIFSPTPTIKLEDSNQIYIPSIFGYNNGNITNLGGFNSRILYANTIGLTAGDVYTYWTNGYGVGTPATMSVYPYASFADDPLNPSQSLNFGGIESFYPNYNDTINNLYYTYYQNTFLELNSAQSRIIEAYFNLTPADISNFSFADLFYISIDNVADYYRVNKILDYDPSKYESTKVELIKALNYTNNLFDFADACGVVVEKCLVEPELTTFLSTINSYYGSLTPYLTLYSNAPTDPTYFTYEIISSTTSISNVVDWANTNDGMVATYYPGVTGCTLNFEVEMGEEATNVFVGSLNLLWDDSPANGGSGPEPYVVIYINYPCGATFGTWEENNNTYFWTLDDYYDQYTFLDWWLLNIPGSYGTASGESLAENAYLKIGWDWETACTQSATCSGEGLQLYIAQSNVDYLPGGWTPDLFVEEPILGPTSGPVYDQGGLTYGISQDICLCVEEALCFVYTSTLPCPGGEAFLTAYISTAVPEEVEETLWIAYDDCLCDRPELSRSAYQPQSSGFRNPPPLSNNAYLGVINTSRDNIVQASNNIVLGENSNVYSRNNIVVGDNNGNVIGGYNFILGASISTTDDSDTPAVLIGNNITNQINGSFVFGNNVNILLPVGLTGSTSSQPTAENLFVIGSNLNLGGSQSILPNTTYLATENIILSDDGGFNTPFIISEVSTPDGVDVATVDWTNDQNIIKTFTGYTKVAANSTKSVYLTSGAPPITTTNDFTIDSPVVAILKVRMLGSDLSCGLHSVTSLFQVANSTPQFTFIGNAGLPNVTPIPFTDFTVDLDDAGTDITMTFTSNSVTLSCEFYWVLELQYRWT
jgi:hypothetical protein